MTTARKSRKGKTKRKRAANHAGIVANDAPPTRLLDITPFLMAEEPTPIAGLFGETAPTEPEWRALYMNAAMRRVRTSLLSLTEIRPGLFVILGGGGVGKSFLMKQLDHALRLRGHPTASFFTPPGLEQLLLGLSSALEIAPPTGHPAAWRRRFHAAAAAREPVTAPVLLLDNAEIVRDEVLLGLPPLVQMKRNSESALRVILAGRPPLEKRLERAALAEVRRLVRFHGRLAPFSDHDIALLIHKRALAAPEPERVSCEAIAAICRYSAGLPGQATFLWSVATRVAAAAHTGLLPVHVEEAAYRLRIIDRPAPSKVAPSSLKHRQVPLVRSAARNRHAGETASFHRPMSRFGRATHFGAAIAAALTLLVATSRLDDSRWRQAADSSAMSVSQHEAEAVPPRLAQLAPEPAPRPATSDDQAAPVAQAANTAPPVAPPPSADAPLVVAKEGNSAAPGEAKRDAGIDVSAAEPAPSAPLPETRTASSASAPPAPAAAPQATADAAPVAGKAPSAPAAEPPRIASLEQEWRVPPPAADESAANQGQSEARPKDRGSSGSSAAIARLADEDRAKMSPAATAHDAHSAPQDAAATRSRRNAEPLATRSKLASAAARPQPKPGKGAEIAANRAAAHSRAPGVAAPWPSAPEARPAPRKDEGVQLAVARLSPVAPAKIAPGLAGGAQCLPYVSNVNYASQEAHVHGLACHDLQGHWWIMNQQPN